MSLFKEIIVAPSVLSANFSRMGEAVTRVEESGADWVHLDVMDGSFVPNISFGPKMVSDLRPLTALPFDAHLMINKPENHIAAFAQAGADLITIHLEATIHLHRVITAIKVLGKRAGISIVPSTPVSQVEELLPLVDLFLVMTVNPGFGGQKLIPQCLKKVEQLSQIRKQRGYDYLISVDGGLNRITVADALSAGADVIVCGSAFFSAKNPNEEVLVCKGKKLV